MLCQIFCLEKVVKTYVGVWLSHYKETAHEKTAVVHFARSLRELSARLLFFQAACRFASVRGAKDTCKTDFKGLKSAKNLARSFAVPAPAKGRGRDIYEKVQLFVFLGHACAFVYRGPSDVHGK